MNSLATTNELTDQLFLAVSMITDSKIQELKYDQTIEGVIKSDANKLQDLYVVTTEHTVFEAYSINGNEYHVGEEVYVNIPSGDYSKQKFIIGRKINAEGGESYPFTYTTPLLNFITFEDLTGNSAPTLPRGYKANDPEDGKELSADPAYTQAMAALTTKWNLLFANKARELATLTSNYQRQIEGLVDSQGNVIGSAGEDAKNIEIALDPKLKSDAEYLPPAKPCLADVIVAGANSVHSEDDTDWTLAQVLNKWLIIFKVARPSNVADIPMWTLDAVLQAIFQASVVFNDSERAGILGNLWKQYWNDTEVEEMHSRLADRLTQYKRLTDLYEAAKKKIEEKYAALDQEREAEYQALQTLYAENSDVNHNLLWTWKKGARSAATVCTKMGIDTYWTSYLGAYAPLSGTYGLRIEVTGITLANEDNPSEIKSLTLYFKSNLMYGNPYNYPMPRSQLIIFDISKFFEIQSISIYFWQDHNFIDEFGREIPYKDLQPNIRISGLRVLLGMTADEVEDERVFIYTYDKLSYGANPLTITDTDDLDLDKHMLFIWVHRDGDTYVLVNTPEQLKLYNALIYWYRYDYNVEINGANEPERYAGTNFRLMDNYESFNYTFDEFLLDFPDKECVQHYKEYTAAKQNQYDLIQAKIDTHQYDERQAAYWRMEVDMEWDGKIENARRLCMEELAALGEQKNYNKFTLNVRLDPERLAERFRAVVKYPGGHRMTDVITFTNLDTTLEEGVVSDADFIFKILRKQYTVTPEGTYVDGHIAVEEGRDAFFVYDELSKVIRDEADNDYSTIDWYIQIWMKNRVSNDYIPLTVNDESDDHFTVKWNFPGNYTMIHSVSDVTDAEAIEMLDLADMSTEEDSEDLKQLKKLYIYKTTLKFRINNFWDVRYTNNTIAATIVRMGHTYHVQKEFFFGRSGTDGSEWTIIIHQVEPETVGLKEGQRFKLAAEVRDRFGRRAESAGFIFDWYLLSPTTITLTNGEAISPDDWLHSQWDTLNITTYGNYLGNGITGFVRNKMPPIFKVEVRNCAPYTLSAYKACTLTNNWGDLVREYQYSVPSRVEFKSDGKSPNYLASPFLKWSLLNDEINYEYPEWQLKLKLRLSNDTWVDLETPEFFRLISTRTRAAQLTTNEVIELPVNTIRRVNNCLREMAYQYNWTLMDESRTYTLDDAEEYLNELEVIAAEAWLQSGQDTALLNQQKALIRGDAYDIILEGAGLLRGAYTEYTLDPYIDPATNKPRISWAWIEGMDTDYYTYIGYEVGESYYRLAIVCCRNVYPSSLINSWDGLLTIDEENNAIMAQMISAGTKDSNNRFSGVMMGDWHNHNDGSIDIPGLYGFNAGVLVFGFKNDATGFIGKAGKGLICFNGKYSLISNYDRTCYLNLDPITQTSDSQFTPGSYYGYSPYFLYAQVKRRVDITSIEDVEDLKQTTRWASKFFNDPTHDYFVVDPNHGMITTGGVVASYGKIGNWMIGKHGMYQYFSGEGLEVIPGLTGVTLPPNSRYMYLGYNITGGWIDDASVVLHYRNLYEGPVEVYIDPEPDPERRSKYDGRPKNLLSSTDMATYNASLPEGKTELPDDYEYNNSAISAIRVASIYRCIHIRHLERLDALNAYGRNLHETVEMLFEMLEWLKNQVHDGVRDLPNDVFELDPYHYMNVGWGYLEVANYLTRCLEDVGYGQESTAYTTWINENISDIFNEETYAASDHYHYYSDGRVRGVYRTGWQYTMGPILGYTYNHSTHVASKSYNLGSRYSYSAAYAHNPAVSVATINPYWTSSGQSVTASVLETIITECNAGYEIYLQDCYKLLMEMYYLAIERDTIPQSDWDYMREHWPGFFTPKSSALYDATVLVLINRENLLYEKLLQELYRLDEEHKYAIYCGYYPDWENEYSENDYHKPLFSVNWRGYMTARAGKIGSTSPWFITDYGMTLSVKLTTSEKFGTIFLGDPNAPSRISDWTSVAKRDRKTLKLLKNAWNDQDALNESYLGPLTRVIREKFVGNTLKEYIELEYGHFAIYAGNENDGITFGLRTDGTVFARRGMIGGWSISDNFLGHYVPIFTTGTRAGQEVPVDENGRLVATLNPPEGVEVNPYKLSWIQENVAWHKNVELNGRDATIMLGTLEHNAKLSIAGFDIYSVPATGTGVGIDDTLASLLNPPPTIVPTVVTTNYKWNVIGGGSNGSGSEGTIGDSSVDDGDDMRAYIGQLIQEKTDEMNALIDAHDHYWTPCSTYTAEGSDFYNLTSPHLEELRSALEVALAELLRLKQERDRLRLELASGDDLTALQEIERLIAAKEDQIETLEEEISELTAASLNAENNRQYWQDIVDNGGMDVSLFESDLAAYQDQLATAQLERAALVTRYNAATSDAERNYLQGLIDDKDEEITRLLTLISNTQAVINLLNSSSGLLSETALQNVDYWTAEKARIDGELANKSAALTTAQTDLEILQQLKLELSGIIDTLAMNNARFAALTRQIEDKENEILSLNQLIEEEQSLLALEAGISQAEITNPVYYGWPWENSIDFYWATTDRTTGLTGHKLSLTGDITIIPVSVFYYDSRTAGNVLKNNNYTIVLTDNNENAFKYAELVPLSTIDNYDDIIAEYRAEIAAYQASLDYTDEEATNDRVYPVQGKSQNAWNFAYVKYGGAQGTKTFDIIANLLYITNDESRPGRSGKKGIALQIGYEVTRASESDPYEIVSSSPMVSILKPQGSTGYLLNWHFSGYSIYAKHIYGSLAIFLEEDEYKFKRDSNNHLILTAAGSAQIDYDLPHPRKGHMVVTEWWLGIIVEALSDRIVAVNNLAKRALDRANAAMEAAWRGIRKAQAAAAAALRAADLANEALGRAIDHITVPSVSGGGRGAGTTSVAVWATRINGEMITATSPALASAAHSHKPTLSLSGGSLTCTNGSVVGQGAGQSNSVSIFGGASWSPRSLSSSVTWTIAGSQLSISYDLLAAVEACFESRWESISASVVSTGDKSVTIAVKSPGGRTKNFTINVTLAKGAANGEMTYKTSSKTKPSGCTESGTCYSRSDGATRYTLANINPKITGASVS